MNSQKKLLIIEDDPIVANIYRSRFEKEGYQVEVADDGQTGFYRIHEFRPDVVLLDLMLPHINGVDILKKIRAQKQFEKLPIIVFTNAYFREMIHDAMQAGATKVFHKATLTPKQIIETVEEALFSSFKGAAPGQAPNTPSPSEEAEPASPAPGAEPSLVTPRPPPPPAPEPPMPSQDARFEAELRQTFFNSATEKLAGLRKLLQGMVKSDDETVRLSQVSELYRKVHSIAGSAAMTGLSSILQVASSLEALLKELSEKPKNINLSTVRTVANGIDFLGMLLDRGVVSEPSGPPPHCILVVDDEIISRKAVVFALEKSSLKAITVEDPNIAFSLLAENRFDLLILDVDMPGMNGFEFCKKVRTLPAYKDATVIFVTSLNDFESRAQSTISGGNDLIAKPFVFTELAAKALMYIIKSQLPPLKR